MGFSDHFFKYWVLRIVLGLEGLRVGFRWGFGVFPFILGVSEESFRVRGSEVGV